MIDPAGAEGVAVQFNQLNPAQAERLALLLEECGEVVQAIGKILRHGYGSKHPTMPGPTNDEALEQELGDVLAAMKLLADAGDITESRVTYRTKWKLIKVGKYLHHQVKS